MKIFISADIEGVTNVTNWDETNLSHPEFVAARQQMTAEVAAACEGAILAGAAELYVKDAHGSGRNLIAAKLPKEVRLQRSWSGHPYSMLQGLDKTFDAVLLVGYHSGAGFGKSPLEHTFTGKSTSIKLNNLAVSECLIGAYTAAYLNIPLVFVSGDKGLCEQVTTINPRIQTVAVKEGVGDATINIHPDLAITRIREGVKQAVSGNISQCKISLPEHFSLEIRYRSFADAYENSFYPGAKQIDTFSIQYECDDYFDILRILSFVI